MYFSGILNFLLLNFFTDWKKIEYLLKGKNKCTLKRGIDIWNDEASYLHYSILGNWGCVNLNNSWNKKKLYYDKFEFDF